MSISLQIAVGLGCAALMCIFHVAALAASVPAVARMASSLSSGRSRLRVAAFLALVLIIVMGSHIVQIIFWVVVLAVSGAFVDPGQAIYFAIVTYTTVGYGDVTLSEGYKVFGALASFSGLVTFSVSAAYFLGIVARVFPDAFSGK